MLPANSIVALLFGTASIQLLMNNFLRILLITVTAIIFCSCDSGSSSSSSGTSSSSTSSSGGGGAGHDNPFAGASFYVNPAWRQRVITEPGGQAVADVSTAIWLDRIAAIDDAGDIGLRAHLDNAIVQGDNLLIFVIYNVPDRDCAASASTSELSGPAGYDRYRFEFIDPIAAILADPAYIDLRIVLVIEPDALPNIFTNFDISKCNEAAGPGGYIDSITYALDRFASINNVYTYLDIAQSAWLGWEGSFVAAIDWYQQIILGTNNGWNSIAGFISNISSYIPTEEPFLPDPELVVGGNPVRGADFYQLASYFDELSYTQGWREAMIAKGGPATLGMLIETSRNGWGGPERPAAQSDSTDTNTFVNESRVDRRPQRSNWCNQASGMGYRPESAPQPGIDAYVWIKPPGESDGDALLDPMCNPAVGNAMPNAPTAGLWFSDGFQVLLQKAYPPL